LTAKADDANAAQADENRGRWGNAWAFAEVAVRGLGRSRLQRYLRDYRVVKSRAAVVLPIASFR